MPTRSTVFFCFSRFVYPKRHMGGDPKGPNPQTKALGGAGCSINQDPVVSRENTGRLELWGLKQAPEPGSLEFPPKGCKLLSATFWQVEGGHLYVFP